MKIDAKICRTAVVGAASVALFAGCKNEVKDWENAPGTRGVINLDAVKEAFQKNDNVSAFEKRVNEIFEGDNIVVFKADYLAGGGGFTLGAAEDLDKNQEFSSRDEKLFALTISGGKAVLAGLGANSYYRAEWPYKPKEAAQTVHSRPHSYYGRSPYFYHWYFGRGPRRGYFTSRDRYGDLSRDRDAYRRTSGFSQQVQKNATYETAQSKKHGSKFSTAVSKPSSTRQSYLNSQKKNSQFVRQLKSKSNPSSSAMAARSKLPSKSSGFSSAMKSSGKSKSSSSSSFGGFRSSSGVAVS